MVCDDVLKALGNTPLIRLRRMAQGCAEVLVKFEGVNIGGSIKTRTAFGMVEEAERSGALRPGCTIVEATSGNQGIGLALVAAVKGYKCVIVMPDNMSIERRKLMKAYGAEIVLVPAGESIAEAIENARNKAKELAAADPNVWLANQFSNPANPAIHSRTTALEIIEQVGGKIDAFCAGIGTGGTITGVGRVLKQRWPNVLVAAVEPTKAALLAGGKISHHAMQGMGDGVMPDILDRSIIDRVILVEDEEAIQTARDLARREGLLVGVSSGANTWAALQLARELGPGKTVVTVLPDTGERYLSTDLYND
ncbi:MAG TPA: cysteine synthase A [Firmicutes bacterium]|nr:cysteine synthase A [Bacillota bacterium]